MEDIKIECNRGAGVEKERSDQWNEFRSEERAKGVPIDREGSQLDSGTIKELECKWKGEWEREEERNSFFFLAKNEGEKRERRT